MAQDQDVSTASLVHHYTHVAVSLNETRKGVEVLSIARQESVDAIDHTIKGVCQLIDKLVSKEHVGDQRAN